MKTLTIIFSIMTLVTINSYSQSADFKGLLDKPETRKEVFNAILNDHNYMIEFIQDMHGNQHAMMMMNSNNQMMENNRQMGMKGNNRMSGNQGCMGMNNHHIMGNQEQMDMNGQNPVPDQSYMMNMMHKNPAMMQMMMGNTMEMCGKDTTMSSVLANTMLKHPEMMQMCMQKMKDNGMMGADGQMKMMNTVSPKMQQEHNHQH